ncbi:class I SAM-dependent methyltransferase [Enemella sp. A6]|uniref:class I SAM-dependent methyltransferase n=1 Tax=Enemella sp. A6 TaxID=3440152 RepID=UPI003EBB81FA
MDAHAWDDRYAGTESVWSPIPNVWIAELLGERTPGTAVDLAAGEGRHALWLAGLGWTVTAVDFSAQGLTKGRETAEQVGLADRLDWVVADVVHQDWPAGPYDAVVLSYLQVPAAERAIAMQRAAAAVAEGGVMVVVGHDTANPEHGHGGPQNPEVLYNADDLLADLADTGLTVQIAEIRKRSIEGAPRPALDVVLLATR